MSDCHCAISGPGLCVYVNSRRGLYRCRAGWVGLPRGIPDARPVSEYILTDLSGVVRAPSVATMPLHPRTTEAWILTGRKVALVAVYGLGGGYLYRTHFQPSSTIVRAQSEHKSSAIPPSADTQRGRRLSGPTMTEGLEAGTFAQW